MVHLPSLAAATVLLTLATYYQIRLSRISGVTGFTALAAFASFAYLLSELTMARLRTSRATRVNIRLLVGASLVALGGTEVFLRLGVEQLASYPERNGGGYVSLFQDYRNRYLTYLPGQAVRMRRPEFDHVRTASELGLTNPSLPAARAANEFRIVALGDSFTEGVGTTEDATWVKVLERTLAARYPDRQFVSLNAGISGSDPVFEYVLFKERLLPMRPDLVIVAINYSDVNNMVVRGGPERFQPDGTVRYRSAPVWEPLYAVSYITRLVVHRVLGFDALLSSGGDMAGRVREATRTIRTSLEEFRALCEAEGITLLVVAHPLLPQIAGGADPAPFEALLGQLENDPRLHFADLLDDYRRDGTMTRANAMEVYWPVDRHHTPEGYRIMGETIARHVVEMGLVDGGNGGQ